MDYGRIKVPEEISVDVDSGEAVALIGANGAGKATTMRAVRGAGMVSGMTMWENLDVGTSAPQGKNLESEYDQVSDEFPRLRGRLWAGGVNGSSPPYNYQWRGLVLSHELSTPSASYRPPPGCHPNGGAV